MPRIAQGPDRARGQKPVISTLRPLRLRGEKDYRKYLPRRRKVRRGLCRISFGPARARASSAFAFLSLILMVVSATSCSTGNSFGTTRPPKEEVLRVGLGADPGSLDPARDDSAPEDQVVINLFEGLLEYDPAKSELRPALAEHWQSNADSTRFDFYLRKDGRWSNGDPVTAHDFVYSWRRALDPRLDAGLSSLLYPIRNAEVYQAGKLGIHESDVGVHAENDLHLVVELATPAAHFPRLLGNGIFRPVHRLTVEQWGDQWATPEHMVCNGPYVLKEWRRADRIVLSRNPDYWNAAEVELRQATFFLTKDQNALLNLYKAGEIDTLVTGLLPIPYVPTLRRLEDYRTGPYLMSYFYACNVRRPPLDNPRLRRALSLAIDRSAICNQLLRGGQSPAYSLTPSDFGGTYPRPTSGESDPGLARQMISEAGFPAGKGLTLRLLTVSDQLNSNIAQAIQGQWQQAFPQLEVQLLSQEFQVYLDTMHRGDFDLVRRSWTGDYDDPGTFLELLASTSENNVTGWRNADYDEYYRRANTTPSAPERMSLFAKAERILLEDQAVIPLYSGVTLFLTKPYVRGWETNQVDRHPLKYVRLER